MLSVTGGDVALIVLAAFWGVLVLFISGVLVALFRVLVQTESLLEGIREQTVPLLGEVRVTVTNVNKQLERADTLMDSAGKMAKSAQRVTSVVEQTVSNPLIKVMAFGAGLTRAIRRGRGET